MQSDPRFNVVQHRKDTKQFLIDVSRIDFTDAEALASSWESEEKINYIRRMIYASLMGSLLFESLPGHNHIVNLRLAAVHGVAMKLLSHKNYLCRRVVVTISAL